jgi:hypothetical protein
VLHIPPRAPSAGAVSEAALFARIAPDPAGPCRPARADRMRRSRTGRGGASTRTTSAGRLGTHDLGCKPPRPPSTNSTSVGQSSKPKQA